MTVDSRMQSFVESSGVVPFDAGLLRDDEARHHGAPWIQRLLGKGIACDYVIGYVRDKSWWTFCFERRASLESPCDGPEIWKVEAYDSIGRGWSDLFQYWPDGDRWQLLLIEEEDESGSPATRDATCRYA